MSGGGEYAFCPSCGNKKEGNALFRCRSCGMVFCEACCDGFWSKKCPKCKANATPGLSSHDIGRITKG